VVNAIVFDFLFSLHIMSNLRAQTVMQLKMLY